MNWLLPLETLPGWPEAPAVSTSHLLLLMLIGPLLVGAVIALLAFTPALGRRFRGELVTDDAHVQEYRPIEDPAHEHQAIEPLPRRGEPEIGV